LDCVCPHASEAQGDATILAIRDMELAGVGIITDGEQRRESYSNRFATALEGVDSVNFGTALDRTGHPNPVPCVVGPIRHGESRVVDDLRFLRKHATRPIKITVPGPFTMSQQAQDDFYGDEEALALGYAAAVNEEIKDFFAAEADVVQVDDPYVQARPEKARAFAVKALNRALEGVVGTTAVHICFGYAQVIKSKPSGYSFLSELADAVVDQVSIEAAQPRLDLSVLAELGNKTVILGVLDLDGHRPESPETVAERLRAALKYVPPERLISAPDCGMKYLPRDAAFAKLEALVAGTAIVRSELGIK
jgi:5-methyltetrahydropteroyltriglutamate--homocysteine methyltransferase